MALEDEASGIRTGEELPLKKIEPYIRENIKGIDGPITIQQIGRAHV